MVSRRESRSSDILAPRQMEAGRTRGPGQWSASSGPRRMEMSRYSLPGNRKRTVEPDPMVFLGYCHPGVVRHEFLRSLLALVQHVGNESFQLIISDAYTGPLISRARCILAETFLATPAQYLLFVDTDIDFEPTFIGKLIAIDKPIVGALYYGVQHSDYSSFPTALLQQEDGYYRPIGVIPDDTAEVDAVGMGFTLIKREVVEAIGADSEKLLPFAEGIWKDRVVGEDLMFCLRAKEKGYSTWLAPQLRVRHMKTIAV